MRLFAIFICLCLTHCAQPESESAADVKKSENDDRSEKRRSLEAEGEKFESESGVDTFKGCGFSSFKDAGNVVNQTATTGNVRHEGKEKGIKYSVDGVGDMTLKGSISEVTLTSNFPVVNGSHSKAKDKAREVLAKKTGMVTAQFFETDRWQEAYSDRSEKFAPCAIFMAKSIENNLGGLSSSVDFDKPVPYFVSPSISKGRFGYEFKNGPISASGKLAKSNDPAIPSGSSYNVVLTPIMDPPDQIGNNEGGMQPLDAEFGYRVEVNLEGGRSGLGRATTYYIKDGAFVAIEVDTGEAEFPLLRYFGT